jgi:glucose-6-phosphate 1-dehydrogenase
VKIAMQAATGSRRWQRAAAALLLVVVLGAAGARVAAAAPAPLAGPAAPPTTFVVFGASGDLAKRKIFPSLKALWEGGKLPADFKIVAASRDRMSRAEFIARLREGVSSIGKVDVNDPAWKEIESRIEFRRVDLGSAASVRSLRGRLDAIDRETRGPPRQRLIYLAVTPSVLDRAIDNLGRTRLLSDGPGGGPTLLVEKPFGRDFESARKLDGLLAGRIPPERVLRMDHYLGKPAIDDLRQLRKGDQALDAVWNRDYIDHVEISAREKIGIEGRGEFYEETGALRDFVQGHLVQMLEVTAMDARASGPAARDAKTEVVDRLRPFSRTALARDVVRMQYKGYRAEPGVSPRSNVETYVALTAHVDSPRWRGVPFLLESGKGLGEKRSAITVHFKKLSPELAARFGVPADQPAVLDVTIDPAPSIALDADGRRFQLAGGDGAPRPEPYERLLLGAMRREHELFVGDREVEGAWRWLHPVQRAWAERKGQPRIATYERGVMRPDRGERLYQQTIRRKLRTSRTAGAGRVKAGRTTGGLDLSRLEAAGRRATGRRATRFPPRLGIRLRTRDVRMREPHNLTRVRTPAQRVRAPRRAQATGGR